ncbi:hypothetical protein HPB50_025746 [Hyalomma asiaticum]|uniref:Uncharacterized protein n=1 Tax=Hyalomma asiaticum TaxID=266040 RepID=A0ACB7SR58_HYAAI|nr:hypothetical protein HPB50_025746 [Hyalomma asiaticum]
MGQTPRDVVLPRTTNLAHCRRHGPRTVEAAPHELPLSSSSAPHGTYAHTSHPLRHRTGSCLLTTVHWFLAFDQSGTTSELCKERQRLYWKMAFSDYFYGLCTRRSRRQPQVLPMRTRRDINVGNDNLLRARKYVDTVMERLRSEMRRRGIGTAELRTMDAGSEWELRNGTITGMENVSHDGSPYPVAVLPENIDGGPTKTPVKVHYDVSASVLMLDIKFEAAYDYISPEQTVKGKVSGRMENVRLDMVIGHNLLRARKYVDTVLERLRSEMRRLGIGTAELRTMHAGSEWELRNGTITGMKNVSHDGSPYPIPVLPENIDGAPTKKPVKVKYDVWAALLMQDIEFEAAYDYISSEQTVKGKVSGRIENVRLHMIISHPLRPDGAPELTVLVVTLHSGVRLSEESIGVLNEKKLRDATEKVLGTCIEEAISSRVAPVLNEVLKGIAFPKFTDFVY